jgi:hypothetical protein
MLLIVISVLSLGILASGCTQSETLPTDAAEVETGNATADIVVQSLSLSPSYAVVGDTVTATVEVRNRGLAEGVYEAVLQMDGVEVHRANVVVGAASSEGVSFEVVCDTAGSHEIRVGTAIATLTVAEPAPPLREFVQLKHDDGESDGSQAFGSGPMGYAHAVRFTPTTTPFTVDRVKIYGRAYGDGCESRAVEVQLRDLSFNTLDFARCPHTEFGDSPAWVSVDMGGVAVEDEFYIVVITDSPKECGISVFYDSDSENLHSEQVVRAQIGDWTIQSPKARTNWMIRVEQGAPPDRDGSLELESPDYFPTTEGYRIAYHVTDEKDGLDCVVVAEAQHPEPFEGRVFDFDFQLTPLESATGTFTANNLAGSVARDFRGHVLTMFWFGHPSGNQGNFYMLFSLPRYFVSGDTWEVVDAVYRVEQVGAQTVGGVEFQDCVRVDVDDSNNQQSESLRGAGHFMLARDVGIVRLVFDRLDGTRVQFEYFAE